MPINKLIAFLLVCSCFFVSPAIAADDDYKNLEIFTDIYSLIRANYVEDVDSKQLIYGAIKGMLATLDPHSSFLTPDMYSEMQADTHGEFGGLGIEITLQSNTLLVVSPIEGTPADKAGVQAGDEIIEIDGVSTADVDIMEAVSMLRGPQGKPVSLLIKRPGINEPIAFNLIRDLIQIVSVKGQLLNDKYGYIRIAQFQDRTADELKDQLIAFRAAVADNILQGVILDLRNNPGGLLDQAVAVSDLFIGDGLIVYTEGRDPQSQLEFRAHSEGTEPLYPLIVLINGGSASAAEIVSGALQDHGRAVIMGEQSFGKGSVQTMIPMSDGSGLKLTTARYFTPKGRSIQALGITPDILVPLLFERAVSVAGKVRESDLQNHFLPATGSDDPVPLDNMVSNIKNVSEDYLLQRAVDLFKGLSIISKQRKAN